MRSRENDLPAHGGHLRRRLSAKQIGPDGGERRRAEETAASESQARLQAREEFLQIFLKNVPAGVAMLDRQMRYLQVSDR